MLQSLVCCIGFFRIWVATFIVGTVNDYIFMLLPVVDNFWQEACLDILRVLTHETG